MILDVAYNVTNAYSSTASITTIGSWLPLLAVVIAAAIVIGIVLTAVSFWWFKKVADFINGFSETLNYVFWGAGTVSCFVIASWGIWEFLAWNNESNIPLWYYPLGAVGYALLYAVGRVSEDVYRRLEKNYNKAKKMNRINEVKP